MPGVDKSPDDYLQNKKIPELFQSLTIALLYNKPNDHIDYLLTCLDEIKGDNGGSNRITWDKFLPPTRSDPSVNNGGPLPNVHGVIVSGTRQ